MHVLAAGYGWLGTAVARALAARGDRVTEIRRDPAGAHSQVTVSHAGLQRPARTHSR